MDGAAHSVKYERNRVSRTDGSAFGKKGRRTGIKDKDWILKKKELNRKRGKETPLDSKFTARKRRPRF